MMGDAADQGMTQKMAVLRTLHGRFAGQPLNWVLTGSMAFALQGVPLTPNDIDVQTDAAGAQLIARLFAEHVTQPITVTESTHTRSHLGALLLDGVKVEIMGDMQKRLPDGSWAPPVDLPALQQIVHVQGMQIPVLPLSYEADAYERMGRTAKAAMLRSFLGKEAS